MPDFPCCDCCDPEECEGGDDVPAHNQPCDICQRFAAECEAPAWLRCNDGL